jgi:hypothetical protein
MAETITPVVHGGRGKWVGALALHVVGATVTAGAFGAALGWIGRLLGAPWGRAGWILVGLSAAAYALSDIARLGLPVPQLRRQVPDWWRTFFGPWATAFLYGAGLGVGFFTFLSHGAPVVVAIAAAASGRPTVGAALVGAFGLARGFTAAVGSGVETLADGRRLVDRLTQGSDRTRRMVNGAALAVVALLSLAAAARAVVDGWTAVASAAVAVAFAAAAVSKIASPRGWRRAVAAHRLPRRIERLARPLTPIAEAAVPALALLGAPRAAAWWALGLLALFTAEVVRMRATVGPRVACGCFGRVREVAVANLLARNAALGALASLVVVTGGPLGVARWPGAPGHGEILPIVLATAGALVAVFAAWRSAAWLARGATA